jgi:hypothetical protein
MSDRHRSDRSSLFGVGGIALMAICCVVGPATLGAIAGATIGSAFGVVAAVLVAACVAVAATLLTRRKRDGRRSAC